MPKIRVKNLPVTTLVEADVDVPDGPPGTLQARIAGAVLSGRWSRTASEEAADLDLEADDQSLDGTWEFKVVPMPHAPAPPGRVSLTYGEMPAREQYDAAWDAALGDARSFSFRNDSRAGTADMGRDELWAALQSAKADYDLEQDAEATSCFIADAGDWCSSVLGRLGIEWV